MTDYTLEEAQRSLGDLLRRARNGEAVSIADAGERFELRPAPPAAADSERERELDELYEQLRIGRESRPAMKISSVELFRQMWEEDEV